MNTPALRPGGDGAVVAGAKDYEGPGLMPGVSRPFCIVTRHRLEAVGMSIFSRCSRVRKRDWRA